MQPSRSITKVRTRRASRWRRRQRAPPRVAVTIANFIDVNSFKNVWGQKERKIRNKQKVKSCGDFKAVRVTHDLNSY